MGTNLHVCMFVCHILPFDDVNDDDDRSYCELKPFVAKARVTTVYHFVLTFAATTSAAETEFPYTISKDIANSFFARDDLF